MDVIDLDYPHYIRVYNATALLRDRRAIKTSTAYHFMLRARRRTGRQRSMQTLA